MFDITSSKLLILGIVALLVIGPKDLPALLRTIGKYMGIIKRHAAAFAPSSTRPCARASSSS